MKKLTHQRLLEVLHYEPDTGYFRWKVRTSNRTHVGDRAGVVTGGGYRFLTVDGEKLQASRLAWFYTHGEWPKGDIKFQNGNSDDCSIANLKDVSKIEAARLRGALETNTTGYRGVSPSPKGGFKAAITANYNQVNLGVFDTAEKASAAYEQAMTILVPAKIPEECEVALGVIIQLRRKRVAWDRLQRSGRKTLWTSLEQFCADIGSVDADESTIAAVDESRPIGPDNFKWLGRPHGEFDRSTKEGRAAYMKAYREANPGLFRHAHLKSNYGMDDIDYHRMLAAQGGVCAICKKEEPRGRKLSFDHDHATGKVRSLLCSGCNQAIGYIKENPDALSKAVDYLKKHQSPAVLEFKPTRPDRDWLLVATPNFEDAHA